ncbi:MAG: phosphoglucomutase [Spirochaetia bacterium]|jgi:phosphomannomutase|nr:phosphoglucomutase [Spirochaetia bacterium]
MKFIDSSTNLFIADSQGEPLGPEIPTSAQLQESLGNTILSASGWRKVFASSGKEEDKEPSISIPDRYLCCMMALSLAHYLGASDDNMAISKDKTILVGIDARPTGPTILDLMTRTLLSCGFKVRSLFIAAAPQIMAYSAMEKADAFLYITASHNPIGHNGIKFGTDGGVFPGPITAQLAKDLVQMVHDPNTVVFCRKLIQQTDISSYEQVLADIPNEHERSCLAYRSFVLQTASMGKEENKFLTQLKEKLTASPIGIVGEFNGSARAASIDKEFLAEIGIKTCFINDMPRQIVHGIVPEGINLEPCRKALETTYAKDKDFLLGYVPDNDGDRGNLVYIKESDGKAYILKAQEVFALVALAVLSKMRMLHPDAKLAIAVNGPTSNRIDALCHTLNVEVARAEVGEANVVQLAQQLRDKGYLVKLLGEGSNGGNITFPAKVRDPMNTLMSLVDLLTDPDIFATFRKLSGYKNTNLTIENILNSLPKYSTTDAFSKQAKLHVTKDHGLLKTRFEELFRAYFEKHKEMFEQKFGITSWVEYQMEGTVCRQGVGSTFRTPPYKGGLKISFCNELGVETDFIWMRGSGTEPIFRILVDCRGCDSDRHDFLLNMERELITQADTQ